jgi:hypothetical protein
MNDFGFQKVKLEVVSSFADAEEADRKYYLSLTGQERLQVLQHLREINHGGTRPKFQRVFEYTRTSSR